MRKENFSGWLWGVGLPLLAIAAAPFTHGITLLLLITYLPLMWKVYRYRQQLGDRAKPSMIYAFFCVVSKVPQAIGQGQYWLSRWQQKPATLIEYKGWRSPDDGDRCRVGPVSWRQRSPETDENI